MSVAVVKVELKIFFSYLYYANEHTVNKEKPVLNVLHCVKY